ncbi:MAG: sulfotransferase [Planctomycetota bacterium]
MPFSPQHIKRRMRQRRRWRRDARLRAAGWYDPSARSDQRPVFIGGCGRSGTTLFKEVLNRHPNLACGPETSLYGLPFFVDYFAAPWGMDREVLLALQAECSNLVEFADRFAQRFLEQEGKQRWVEKTPNNVRALGPILTWYPDARFIHVIRDGRDVACSLRNHPKERIENGQIVPLKTNNPMDRCAMRWRDDVADGLAYRGHPRVIEVRYEDLVRDPASQFSRVCAFIGERFDGSMLHASENEPARVGQNLNNPGASSAITPKAVGRWERDLSESERCAVDDIAGELLIALGYAPDHAWVGRAGG